jgi:hypothetical protein
MKKAFTLALTIVGLSVYSQPKSMSLTAEDVLNNKLTISLKIVEEKSIAIPVYKDTLVETSVYKELVAEINPYKKEYDQWLELKKSNEAFNADIATIINNLETYSKSKEKYETTKPLIEEAQHLIFKNKIFYHDRYGRTNNALIILSSNGKKPQKTRTLFDTPDYETPLERCLSYCKSIKKLEEPYKDLSVIRYQEFEKKLAATQQFETIRVPSNKTVMAKRLLRVDTAMIQESDLIGTFTISESKYAVALESEGHAHNELIEVGLLNSKATPTKNMGSEIFTNDGTGIKYFSENTDLVQNIELQKNLVLAAQQTKKDISKYGTVYYDKEQETDMLKIQTGALKLSSYNPEDIAQFVSIYNSLYSRYSSVLNQMPAHISILKKYYTLHRVQGRNMSQTNINAWIKAVKSAAPLRTSLAVIIMNEHFGDFGFYPNLKYEGRHEDFDLYYNASLSILGL